MSSTMSPLIAIVILSLQLENQTVTASGMFNPGLVPTIGFTLNYSSAEFNSSRHQHVTQPLEKEPVHTFESSENKEYQRLLLESQKDIHNSTDAFVKHKNNFKCPPCVCTDRSEGAQTALCKGVKIAEVPKNLKEETEMLTMVETVLNVLDTQTLSPYRRLKSAVVSNNTMLTRIRRSPGPHSTSNILHLVVHKNQIENVESYSFRDMALLLTLSLSKNRLSSLTDNMFVGLGSLRKLDVSRNYIQFVGNKTFQDLQSLLILDISGNLLQINDPLLLPPSAFMTMGHLEELYIQGNCEHEHIACSFPRLIIEQLKSLRVLAIDVHSENNVGPESKTLSNLKTLIIDSMSFCSARILNETFFENTPKLVSLTIKNCPLLSIPPEAYSKLLFLENLTISAVPPDYNLCLALSDIQGLRNAPLKYLTLSGVNKYDCACRKLSLEGKYLALFNLTVLDISWNNIINIYPGFAFALPKSLRKMDLSGNDLSAGVLYRPLTVPDKLAELNLNYESYQYTSQCSEEFVERDFHNDKSAMAVDNLLDHVGLNKNKHDFHLKNASSVSENTGELQSGEENGNVQFVNPLYFHFPTNVYIWNAISFPQFGILVLRRVYEHNSSLVEINFSGGFLETWGTSHMLSKIKRADLSNNFCRDLSTKFFPKNNSLEYFYASNNYLGNVFSNDSQGLIFAKVKKLRFLDISKNLISELPHKFFKGLISLQTLKASDNKLQMIDCSFAHMKDLRFIDVSKNSITWLSRRTRNDLDLIAMDHDVYLDLTTNPLPCTCAGIDLMQWLASTKVFLLNEDFLVCVNETNEIEEIGNIFARVKVLKRQCSSKNALIVTCVFFIVSFIIVLTTSLMYRYRWLLRYLLNAALAKLFGKKSVHSVNSFQFDAYILYTDETRLFVLRDCVRELETMRGHRLCIEEREFLPGTYMASDILSGVRNSYTTVAMVTPEFYDDVYSEYRVKMAVLEENFSSRKLLHVCICEPTRREDLSHDLLNVMKNHRYLECPLLSESNVNVNKEFWDRLSQMFGRSV